MTSTNLMKKIKLALLWENPKTSDFPLLYNLKAGPESESASNGESGSKRCRSTTLIILHKNTPRSSSDRNAYSKSVSIQFLKKGSKPHTQQCFPVGRRRRRLILLLSHLESGGRKMFFLKLSLKYFFSRKKSYLESGGRKMFFLKHSFNNFFSRNYSKTYASRKNLAAVKLSN